MEGQCDCANIQREGGHPGLWELHMHQDNITHHEDLGKNNRPKTEQIGFMPGRGTADAICAARQVIEKHREMQKELHLVFIDLEKAYDWVLRQEVWRCLREQGVPEKYVRLVKDTYEDARIQVKTSIGLTGKITVRVGLHQGSSLSPYLFDMILDVMGRCIKEQPPGVCCLQTISYCAALEETQTL